MKFRTSLPHPRHNVEKLTIKLNGLDARRAFSACMSCMCCSFSSSFSVSVGSFFSPSVSCSCSSFSSNST
jgi:hypothetical protein